MAEYWRDQLRPASFRGVPFEVISREGQGGRVLVKHRYPGRDEGYDEDLNGKPLAFSVTAFIVGPGYLSGKAALIKALRQKGAGELIDQWGESFQVQVDGFTWSENLGQGGYVSFQISFATWSEPAQHTVKTDTGHAVTQAATPAQSSLVNRFGSNYSARGNTFVLADAVASGEDYTRRLSSLLAVRNSAAFQSSATVVTTQNTVATTQAGTAEAVADPAAYAASLRDLLDAALACLDAGWARYLAALALLDYGADFDTITPTTTARRRAAANRALMIELIRGLAAIAAALAAAEIEFAVYDDAVAVRQAVSDALDARMLTADDATYAALSSLRAASVRDIGERGANLARLTDVIPAATLPAVVLAYQLYGDAGREADLVDRNPAIRHPGFVPGGQALKVPNA